MRSRPQVESERCRAMLPLAHRRNIQSHPAEYAHKHDHLPIELHLPPTAHKAIERMRLNRELHRKNREGWERPPHSRLRWKQQVEFLTIPLEQKYWWCHPVHF